MSLSDLIKKRDVGLLRATPATFATHGRDSAAELNSVNSVKSATSSVASCVSNGMLESARLASSSARQATVAPPANSVPSPQNSVGDGSVSNSVVPPVTSVDQAQGCEAFEERAAIMQYDAGLPKEEAEHLAAIDTDCIDCMHFAHPGKSSGYCAGREDLPLAYGANHPLHKLPPDRGATCREWRPLPW